MRTGTGRARCLQPLAVGGSWTEPVPSIPGARNRPDTAGATRRHSGPGYSAPNKRFRSSLSTLRVRCRALSCPSTPRVHVGLFPVLIRSGTWASPAGLTPTACPRKSANTGAASSTWQRFWHHQSLEPKKAFAGLETDPVPSKTKGQRQWGVILRPHSAGQSWRDHRAPNCPACTGDPTQSPYQPLRRATAGPT